MERRLTEFKNPTKSKNLWLIVGGSALFAASVNLFMMPVHLYVGGVVGVAQVLGKLLFAQYERFNISGIINFILNVPMFVLGYKTAGKRMLIGTFCSVIVQTIVFSLVPIPTTAIFEEKLANIVVGGILGGIGIGGVLSGGASGGGTDILGLYLTKVKERFSVGKMNLYFNVALYSVCAILFDLRTALYSVIYITIFSLTIDHYHFQNIEMQLLIFTHNKEVKRRIMDKYIRGVTYWDGKGAYTNKETEVLVTIVSKSEVETVKQDILELDPKAFIICSQGMKVTGGYEKRLN